MRIFIAIPLPENIKENFLEVQEKELKFLGRIKLVEKENLHSTLKFLGEVPQEKVEKIFSELEKIPKVGKFSVNLKSLGVFPNQNYVRVIWVGVEKGNEEIVKLQNLVDDRLEQLNFNKEKNFHPHFTLARVKLIKEKEKLRKILEEYKDYSFGEFEIHSIEVMKSELSREGPTYTSLKKIDI